MGEKRAENAFVKQIFDKSTGCSLMCRTHQTDIPCQTFSFDWWDKECISYDLVMEQVVSALRSEHTEALHIKERVLSAESREEFHYRRETAAEQIRRLSFETARLSEQQLILERRKETQKLHAQGMPDRESSGQELEKQQSEIRKKLVELEAETSVWMRHVSDLELTFSTENPWIRLYAGIAVPDRLQKAQVRAWIDRVLVCEWKTVEVVFPKAYIYWKKQLPAEWFL